MNPQLVVGENMVMCRVTDNLSTVLQLALDSELMNTNEEMQKESALLFNVFMKATTGQKLEGLERNLALTLITALRTVL